MESSNELNDNQKEVVQAWCDDSNYRCLAKSTPDIGMALIQSAEYLYKHYKHKIFILVEGAKIFQLGEIFLKCKGIDSKPEIVPEKDSKYQDQIK